MEQKLLDRTIKELDLVSYDYIKNHTNYSRDIISNRMTKIRLLMFYDGYIVPKGYIGKSYYKKYFKHSILWKNYDKNKIDYLKKMGI